MSTAGGPCEVGDHVSRETASGPRPSVPATTSPGLSSRCSQPIVPGRLGRPRHRSSGTPCVGSHLINGPRRCERTTHEPCERCESCDGLDAGARRRARAPTARTRCGGIDPLGDQLEPDQPVADGSTWNMSNASSGTATRWPDDARRTCGPVGANPYIDATHSPRRSRAVDWRTIIIRRRGVQRLSPTAPQRHRSSGSPLPRPVPAGLTTGAVIFIGLRPAGPSVRAGV